MSNTIRITINTNENSDLTKLVPIKGNTQLILRRLRSFFGRLTVGAWNSHIGIHTGGTPASGTITLASFVEDDTVTINGLILTGKGTPTTNVQFTVNADDVITAVNLAACINAHPSLLTDVIATSAAKVVTIKSRLSGIVGNLMTIAISAHGSVTGAALTGGVQGTNAGTVLHGLALGK